MKRFDDVREDIIAAAEHDVGVSLSDLGVTGVASLYWVPVAGRIRPAAGPFLWGAAPALSTRDLATTAYFETPVPIVVLVENRSALDYLAARACPGVLAIGTDGMPAVRPVSAAGEAESQGGEAAAHLGWLGSRRDAHRAPPDRMARGRVVQHPTLRGREAEPELEWLQHPHAGIRSLAADISRYGAVYQESALSSDDCLLSTAGGSEMAAVPSSQIE